MRRGVGCSGVVCRRQQPKEGLSRRGRKEGRKEGRKGGTTKANDKGQRAKGKGQRAKAKAKAKETV